MDHLIMRPITRREELDLFCRLPYVLTDDLAGRSGCGSP
ncbi:hypothetical protein EV193_11545 [Herbihabitans rhizosphaerae]|uniref:Uncharacterized protein n=1 Tax=Herbihabitans rhizosphaerae TaxID=1872711 RepID=A0A4Q7KDF4_9PSEU|nr:hypothetical protein EV193_11545 [Herbihabitans rhizosphaerae]